MLCGMDQSIKVRENRLRRMAERQGLRLVKSRRRDPLAVDYGRYRIETADGVEPKRFASPMGRGLSLSEVEDRLTTPPLPPERSQRCPSERFQSLTGHRH